jgi:hypothetical protein
MVSVRLFYDFLVEEGVRESNPVGRGRYTPESKWGGQHRGLVPRVMQLPWVPRRFTGVNDRTSISAALLEVLPTRDRTRKPSRKEAGIETRPGLASGNQDQSASGNIDVAVPDTAGENAMSTTVMVRPP